MSSVATTDPPNLATRIARWLGFGVPALLLIACIAGVLWLLLPNLFPALWANRLSRSQGKVELLAAAGEQLDFGSLSPDGRWMVMGSIEQLYQARQTTVFNLVTGERHLLPVRFNQSAWLDTQLFVAQTDQGYTLIDVQRLSITVLPEPVPRAQYLRPGGFHVVEPFFKQAQKIYSVRNWGSSYIFFVQTAGTWQVILLNESELQLSFKQLDNLVASLPHIAVPKYARISDPVTRQHTFSPDGQFYVTSEVADKADVNPRAAIYTRDGRLVASAYKAGWIPYVLGWAHDGSGVYLNFVAAGSAARTLVPYRPLFKLSPYTAEEQRWRLVWMIVAWATGIAVVGGVVWWGVVRRQRVVRG